jgi:hypothetical protein
MAVAEMKTMRRLRVYASITSVELERLCAKDAKIGPGGVEWSDSG